MFCFDRRVSQEPLLFYYSRPSSSVILVAWGSVSRQTIPVEKDSCWLTDDTQLSNTLSQ